MCLIWFLTKIQNFFFINFINIQRRSLQKADDEQTFLADSTTQENTIAKESIKNITLCKNAHKNLYNAVADCLRQSFNYMDKEHLKKNCKYLRLNYFFIEFDSKHNAQDLLEAQAHFSMNQEYSKEVFRFCYCTALLTSYHPVIFMIDLEHQTQEDLSRYKCLPVSISILEVVLVTHKEQ